MEVLWLQRSCCNHVPVILSFPAGELRSLLVLSRKVAKGKESGNDDQIVWGLLQGSTPPFQPNNQKVRTQCLQPMQALKKGRV